MSRVKENSLLRSKVSSSLIPPDKSNLLRSLKEHLANYKLT